MDITIKLYADETKKKVERSIYFGDIHHATALHIPRNKTDEYGIDGDKYCEYDIGNDYLEIEQYDFSLIYYPLSKVEYVIRGTEMTEEDKKKTVRRLRQKDSYEASRQLTDIVSKLEKLGAHKDADKLRGIVVDLDEWRYSREEED